MARVYPEDTTERRWGRRKRQWMHDTEADALGNPGAPPPIIEDRPVVARHGAAQVAIRPGVRPYLKMQNGGAFGAALTERQRRRGKVRTARAWGRMLDMLEKTGMTMEEFVQGLTPEELVRGKLRDSKGGFTGRPPAWVPHEFHRACIRELMRRGKELWQVNYIASIEAMTDIATGKVKGASARDRLTAAQFVIERLEGKTPDIVLVADESPWKMVIDDIVAQVPDEHIERAKAARHGLIGDELEDVVDAEIVPNDPEVVPRTAPTRRRAAAPRRRAAR